MSVSSFFSLGFAFAKLLKMLLDSFFKVAGGAGAGVPSLLLGAVPAAGSVFSLPFPKKTLAAADLRFRG